jgi:hypothetical protein
VSGAQERADLGAGPVAGCGSWLVTTHPPGPPPERYGVHSGVVRLGLPVPRNYSARIGTLMDSGLPMLQQHSPGRTVAVDALIESTGAGLLYADADDIAAALADSDRDARARGRVAAVRDRFALDAHAGTLIALLERASGRSWCGRAGTGGGAASTSTRRSW